eukprot:TRINITY_DN24644_c0_g1_i3.p1 TRINITY_DN24644_c0_g1~~TRINITY_DN24644_c0_g1_i3.p1  ORF type:complete len:196 (+),score=16.24 TRINITY_DN24644_c0_g1_i3:140-727(+)
MYLIGMLVCVVTQTSLLNSAMMLGDMMSVFPVFESFWISFGVLGGLVFFNGRLPPGSWDQAWGLLFMSAGIVCFLLHPDPDDRNQSGTTDTTLSDPLTLFGSSPRNFGRLVPDPALSSPNLSPLSDQSPDQSPRPQVSPNRFVSPRWRQIDPPADGQELRGHAAACYQDLHSQAAVSQPAPIGSGVIAPSVQVHP